MLSYKKIITGLLCFSSYFVVANAATIFSITPLTTDTTVTSNSEAAISYTVTNNSSIAVNGITIALSSNPSGASLSLANDNCTGQTVAAGGACTFDVSIPGSSQNSSFTINPKVCAFSGTLCSKPVTKATVNFIEHSLPTRAYEVLFSLTSGSPQLAGINTANTSNIISSAIADSGVGRDGPLAISPSGNKVYIVHENSAGDYYVEVFNVTANSLSQSAVSYHLSYEGSIIGLPNKLIISPDGNTLYVTNNDFNGVGYPIYRVNLTDSNPATAVTALTDATAEISHPSAILVTPDDSTVYIANSVSGENKIFSFPNSTSTTSISNTVLTTDLSAISSMFISSDGRTLYVAGQLGSGTIPAVIKKYNVADNFSVEGSFYPNADDNSIILSATLAPDSAKMFAVAYDYTVSKYLLYAINTATMTAPAGTEYPFRLIPFQAIFNYVSYAPDGSIVAMTNYGEDSNLTGFFSPSDPSSISSVNPAGAGQTMYSYTQGPFIN